MAGMNGNGPANAEQAEGRELARLRQARVVRRARRRALTDLGLLLLFVAAAALAAGDAHQALLNALLAAAAGILAFLHRRGRDLCALARADHWRADALEGRGLSLSDWRDGAPLPRWAERRDVA